MSIDFVLLSFAKQTGTLYVKAPGTMVFGRYTEGAETPIAIECSDQPATGQEMQILPEGHRSSDTRKLYLNVELKTTDQSSGESADEVLLQSGERYTVLQAMPYYNGGSFLYTKAFVKRTYND